MKKALSPDVRLREVEPGDLPVLFQHQLDPEANRMAVARPRDEHAFNAHWAKILGDPTVVAKAILADGRLVGTINCFKLDGRASAPPASGVSATQTWSVRQNCILDESTRQQSS